MLRIGVKYGRNITDIDDKIIARAAETNSSETELTEKFIRAMHEDETLLNVQPPDKEPRATNFIDEIIDLIDKLERAGYAYQGKDGDVYFRVRKFNGYGKLSKRSVDDLESGARVSLTEAKDDPLDFALWKTWKSGEPFWDSPWVPGRPGWHIECSAMSMSCLGESFDIHAGGMDLKFPHHENEIAQSEAATGKKFVNYWMHNGLLTMSSGQKKSVVQAAAEKATAAEADAETTAEADAETTAEVDAETTAEVDAETATEADAETATEADAETATEVTPPTKDKSAQ